VAVATVVVIVLGRTAYSTLRKTRGCCNGLDSLRGAYTDRRGVNGRCGGWSRAVRSVINRCAIGGIADGHCLSLA
jgi:hypothetical protein